MTELKAISLLAHRSTFPRATRLLAALLLVLTGLCGCGNHPSEDALRYNDLAYHYHYISLDSTEACAKRALLASADDDCSRAEALNHLAFVAIMRMDFPRAKQLCDSVDVLTNSQLELLVSDIQRMRIYQRESHNKSFYDAYQQAGERMRRIAESSDELSPRQRRRMVYAQSEYGIVASAYFYYVGLDRQSVQAISKVGKLPGLSSDTAQTINYYYSIGAGGILSTGSQNDISQSEFDYLMRAYRLAKQSHSKFWVANTLQALSEHLMQLPSGPQLMKDNPRDIRLLNSDSMPDSLLAGNLAERSLLLFRQYGDVYQTAGSLRTLANCYWQIADYQSALLCLQKALDEDTVINRAPDLVASIREQLCLVFSAVDDKQSSDYNRNLYLDLQDQTRQDRYFESRAEQLERTSQTLNVMLAIVAFMILLVVGLLALFVYLRQRGGAADALLPLRDILEQWRVEDRKRHEAWKDEYEENSERLAVSRLHVEQNKRRHIEQRAKVSLVNGVLPLIGRMLLELRHLTAEQESPDLRGQRVTYLMELTQQVNESNAMLTQWIQMRQGKFSVRVESFQLQQLFEVVAKGQTEFRLKGIQLEVAPTEAWVKADRVLTLFMINTLVDNARKHSATGGSVELFAQETENYVEVSVSDTGCGMTEEQLQLLFEYKPVRDEQLAANSRVAQSRSHGFGLMNCKGIIQQYRKLSSLFSVCVLQAESELGKGSRLFFRLPKGVGRKVFIVLQLLSVCLGGVARPYSGEANQLLSQAGLYADSAYQSNIDGTYERTMDYADSCCSFLNRFYLTQCPHGTDLMTFAANGKVGAPEVVWLQDSIPTNYEVILSMRNEVAVAALALHQWETYQFNNKAYTQLFKETSADRTLPHYCEMMQRSEENKQVAIVILVLLFFSIPPAFYFIYYRHRISFLLRTDKIRQLMEVALFDTRPEEREMAAESIRKAHLPLSLRTFVEQADADVAASQASELGWQERLHGQEELLGRLQLEDDRLHLSNSTLDNSLSTLKHETMYYPSRIALLLDAGDGNLDDIRELTVYYRDLYQLLTLQLMEQLSLVPLSGGCVSMAEVVPTDTIFRRRSGESPSHDEPLVVGDSDMLRYLFELMRKLNKGAPLQIEVCKESGYVQLHVLLDRVEADDAYCKRAFLPAMENIPFLLCSQIVRDHGELTNKRRCGIEVRQEEHQLNLIIILPRWNDLKSL